MGIISDIIVETGKDLLESAVVDGVRAGAKATQKAYKATKKAVNATVDQVKQATDVVQGKQISKFLHSKEETVRLLILQDTHQKVACYSVFDSTERIKYKVMGDRLALKHNIHVYDASNNELGTIHEKLLTVRNPLDFEFSPADFILTIGETETGVVKTGFNLLKQNIDLLVNGWSIAGDVFGKKYTVNDSDNETVMTATNRYKRDGDSYYLEISKPEHELLCVMITVAIDAAKESKFSMRQNS